MGSQQNIVASDLAKLAIVNNAIKWNRHFIATSPTSLLVLILYAFMKAILNYFLKGSGEPHNHIIRMQQNVFIALNEVENCKII